MADADNDRLQRLIYLHQDLTIIAENKLLLPEHVTSQLEQLLPDFRTLLYKPGKNDKSRQALAADPVKLDEIEYEINTEAKQQAVAIADILNLDELEAVKLLLLAQRDSQALDRDIQAKAIILYHQDRAFLADIVRICFAQAYDLDNEDDTLERFRQLISIVLEKPDGRPETGSEYLRKCLAQMQDLEKSIQSIAERMRNAAMIGIQHDPEYMEVMEYQRTSLISQHESLAGIAYYLIKGSHVSPDDLKFLLTTIKPIDRYDAILVHYLPILMSSISRFASSDVHCSLREARSLHSFIVGLRENDSWPIRSLQAATIAIWLAEYSGRYLDNPVGSPLQGVNLKKESEARSTLFMDCLRDGAFHFMLSVCQTVTGQDWFDPARQGITAFLLQDSSLPQYDGHQTQGFFRSLVMDQFQSFTDAYITNMPDTLRKLKLEEDEQRRLLHSRVQLQNSEHDLHLERFLLIIAYCFDNSPEAAGAFWTDPDGNLYGFLQWASQRQSTPRIAAFCEMLASLSKGEECSKFAHRFLTEDSPTSSSKLRRNSPLSWNVIFKELEVYSSSLKNKPVSQPVLGQNYANSQSDRIAEPESGIMLESYLRLLAHMCRNSSACREWIKTHPTFRLHEHVVLLVTSVIDSRLKACACTTLQALLTGKTKEFGDSTWQAVEDWVYGLTPGGPAIPRSTQYLPSPDRNLNSILVGFEEPNAFVNLLGALIENCEGETALDNHLNFPESLGSAYRMPGIEVYVDFVLGRVFTEKTSEIQDPLQLDLIRLACLRFVVHCLFTFNESLYFDASNDSKNTTGSASSAIAIATYSRLHPFSRVMEWIFNDRVIAALFATADQDVKKINAAEKQSPLVQGLLLAIEVMSRILDIQTIYFDRVRPRVKLDSSVRRHVVANSALASFEDAVLNNLNIVAALGHYCGSGHDDLAVAALGLLRRLSSSRKLSSPILIGGSRRLEKSRLVAVLEKDNDAETISRALASAMNFEDRQMSDGPRSSGFVIKMELLKFLNVCLETVPDRPTIAHLLLGFTCGSTDLTISASGLFANNKSLFHAIIAFFLECPDSVEGTHPSWLCDIRDQIMSLVYKLWTSKLSSETVVSELRSMDFLFVQILRQELINLNTSWEGLLVQDPAFLCVESADAYGMFLHQRSTFLQYVATELCFASRAGMSTLEAQIRSALLGFTSLRDGSQYQNPTVFDLLDFLDVEISKPTIPPKSNYFSEADINTYMSLIDETGNQQDSKFVTQFLLDRGKEHAQSGRLQTPMDQQKFNHDAELLTVYAVAQRAFKYLRIAYNATLGSWVQLVTVMLEDCSFESDSKQSFVFQTLQIIMPRLETAYADSSTTSLLLTQLAGSLLKHADFAAESGVISRISDIADDKLLGLFRAGLAGIPGPQAVMPLREACYQLCQVYARGIASTKEHALARRLTLQSIKSFGSKLIQVVCDDAYAGEGSCRVSALLFLETIVIISNREKSKVLFEALNRINFIQVLVDQMKAIPLDLQTAAENEIPQVLAYYSAGLSLVLRIAQTRAGATYIMNFGFFQAVRDSGILSADPDVGLDIDNPQALTRYFGLYLSIVQIVNAVILSRGFENDQTISQAREFLHEYRPSIAAILKRNLKIGSVGPENDTILRQIADNIIVMISASGELDVEESLSPAKTARVFS